MRSGDLVVFNQSWGSEYGIGLLIRELNFEEKGRDPFPMFLTFFPQKGILRLRGTYICKLEDYKGH